jgi:hypothetical protein
MRYACLTRIAVVGIAALATTTTEALTHSPASVMGSDEISDALKGMICTTKAGARFTFSGDGHYGYEGFWKNGGHYAIARGAVIVTFDSGLERSYAISRRGDVLYMENTAIVCGPGTTASR